MLTDPAEALVMALHAGVDHQLVGGLAQSSEKGEVLLRGVGALRYFFPPNAAVQWQPDGLTIRAEKWFLGAGFLGAPPASLISAAPGMAPGPTTPASPHASVV